MNKKIIKSKRAEKKAWLQAMKDMETEGINIAVFTSIVLSMELICI
jgi:hypothetical protein